MRSSDVLGCKPKQAIQRTIEFPVIWNTPTWWRHQMETFSALLAICAGNSSVTGEFPAQRPVTRSFDVFFDLRLNINRWVNNGEAGDLRRYRTHYDVIVMTLIWLNCDVITSWTSRHEHCAMYHLTLHINSPSAPDMVTVNMYTTFIIHGSTFAYTCYNAENWSTFMIMCRRHFHWKKRLIFCKYGLAKALFADTYIAIHTNCIHAFWRWSGVAQSVAFLVSLGFIFSKPYDGRCL